MKTLSRAEQLPIRFAKPLRRQPGSEEEELEHVVGEVDGEEESAPKRGRRSKEKNGKKRKYLDMYCTNLTEKAKRSELDAIIGRDQQIYRVIQILSRRTKNNPLPDR